MKLAINGGVEKDLGYTSFGYSPVPERFDIIHDPDTYPWPFEDNSVEEVFINQYLNIPEDIDKFMSELYRVCKPNAEIRSVNGYYTNQRSLTNPYSKRNLSEFTFAFFDKNFRELNNLKPVPYNFKTLGMNFIHNEHWHARSEEQKEFAKIHYFNTIEQFLVSLSVVKE